MGETQLTRFTCDWHRCSREINIETNYGISALLPDGWRRVTWQTKQDFHSHLYCSIECEYKDYQDNE